METLDELIQRIAAEIAEAEGADYAETLAIVRAWLTPSCEEAEKNAWLH